MNESQLYNEKNLLAEIATGDEAAFRHLYDTYRKRLYSYLLKITESKETAEDAIQEIFLKVWQKKEKLPEIENINAYLHRMAHNFAYQGFTKLAKETLVLEQLKAESRHEVMAGHELIAKEVAAYIQSVVDRLTPQQRNVYLLSREEGLKQEEIAERLDISLMAVKKHMVNALQFLREEIGQHYGSQAVAIFVVYQLGIQ